MRATASSVSVIASPRNAATSFHARRPFEAAVLDIAVAARPVRLTPREHEVLSLLCEGLSNKLICRRLDIAAGTVKVHLGSIMRRLGVSTRLQAVITAQRFGLLASSDADQDGADNPLA